MNGDGMVRIRTTIDTTRWTPGEVTGFTPLEANFFEWMMRDIVRSALHPEQQRRKQDWSPRDCTDPL